MGEFTYAAGNEFGMEICRALDIDPKDVTQVVITMNPLEPVFVEVTSFQRDAKGRFMRSDEADAILEVVTRYRLVEDA